MKILYFLALVVLCLASPIDSPPKNLNVSVYQENGNPCFTASWEKVESIGGYPVLGYILKLYIGKLYVNIITKDDGSQKTEVYAPTKPEKPIVEAAEFDIPAGKHEYTYKHMEKGVVYGLAIQAYSAGGRSALSERKMFSYL